MTPAAEVLHGCQECSRCEGLNDSCAPLKLLGVERNQFSRKLRRRCQVDRIGPAQFVLSTQRRGLTRQAFIECNQNCVRQLTN